MRPNHIYHVFPLGALRNGNIRELTSIIPHMQSLRMDSIMLGPIFKSETHGYDVTDMYQVDPRLGNNEDLKQMVRDFHEAGFHVYLDAVWNHSSRHHFAYKDLREKGRNSPYAAWYRNPNFDKPNLCGDTFTVDCWAGFQELPAFNLQNPEVERELIHCAEYWMDEFDIDGVRLDAAENMDLGFLKHLADACHRKRPDFWMMGEVVFGDPTRWLDAGLNSVTNYQTYKSLWSSINDGNMFELAYNLNRFFDDKSGICRNSRLQLFNENHDVSRIYSVLKNKADNYLQHFLFYTLPGVPTLYYGEEFGLDATKGGSDDWNLRPAMHVENGNILFEGSLGETQAKSRPGKENLLAVIRHLASVRQDSSALREGGYQQEFVHSRQLAFWRTHQDGDVLVVANLQDAPVQFEIDLRKHFGCGSIPPKWADLMNPHKTLIPSGGSSTRILTLQIPSKWGCILIPSGI
ncbi:alpha-amylase family glycosyl hydrolase [Fibrobacter sp. UWEL]|uniref:alpha-amylase family glycosyl hydrolase n=1 Tax=Fibrobacter sp. UWEL TaxID=1896209 RepID=UPI0009118D14|nr:alpha-amylase family glycosyl hydrolase [Fibrobacter sp. UWEL]SHL25318.1 Glycosidase [Fibrobacter sp. UWEL]